MAVAADLAEGYSPVLAMKQGCVHFGDKQHVGHRLALGVRKVVYNHHGKSVGPLVTSAMVISENPSTVVGWQQDEEQVRHKVVVSFLDEAGGSLEVRNNSGFELSSNGRDYFASTITSHSGSSVTLSIPSGIFASDGHGNDATPVVASMRYIIHD